MNNRGQCSGYPSLDPAPIKKIETALDFKEIKGETSRTYHYTDGNNFTIKNVVKLCVRPSGNHRVETKDGKKLIMAAGWLCIEIEAEAWVH